MSVAAHRGQKRGSNLEQELQVSVSCLVWTLEGSHGPLRCRMLAYALTAY